MTKPTAQQVGEAVLLLASLFSGGAVATPHPVAAKADKPKAETPTPSVSSSTPAPAKVEPVATGTLTPEGFSKLNIDYARECKDGGAKLKAVWASITPLSGTPAAKASDYDPSQYDEVLAAIEEDKLG